MMRVHWFVVMVWLLAAGMIGWTVRDMQYHKGWLEDSRNAR